MEFAQKEGVEKAMNMNDSSLLSRTLKVSKIDVNELHEMNKMYVSCTTSVMLKEN